MLEVWLRVGVYSGPEEIPACAGMTHLPVGILGIAVRRRDRGGSGVF